MFECLLQCLLPRPKWGLVFGDRILYYSARLILACCGISCMGQQGKLNALLADVESSALITLPNHFNLLLWIVVLHSITLVLLYTSSFLTVFGHFTFSTYVLSSLRWNVSRFFSAWEDVIVQISQFYRKISSIQVLKTVIFFFWGEFLVIENSLYSTCSVYSKDFRTFSVLYLRLYQPCYQNIYTFSTHGLSS